MGRRKRKQTKYQSYTDKNTLGKKMERSKIRQAKRLKRLVEYKIRKGEQSSEQ